MELDDIVPMIGSAIYRKLHGPGWDKVKDKKPWLEAGHEALRVVKLLETQEIVSSGHAGVLPSGLIVDRRIHPEAVVMEKNSFLGVPKPKETGGSAALSLLGYNFADEESEGNAIEAVRMVRSDEGRPAAFCVLGPPASGKTHLVREILRQRYSDLGDFIVLPSSQREVGRLLWNARKRGFIAFDGSSCRWPSGNQKKLMLAAGCSTISWQTSAKKIDVVENKLILFFIGIELDPELAQRCRFIRLLERKAA